MFVRKTYTMLTEDWGMDGDSELAGVVDALSVKEPDRAVQALDEAIGWAHARYLAYTALRSVLVAGDVAALQVLADKDITNISDWTDS